MTSELTSGRWVAVPTETTVTATVKNLKFMTVDTTFDVTSAEVDLTDDPATSKVEVVVDAKSFESGLSKRDEHVKSPDFLDADAHPEIRFVSTGVQRAGTAYVVEGKITLADTSVTASFGVAYRILDDDRVSFTATTQLDRRDLGLSRAPALLISHEVAIRVDGVATTA